MLAYRLDELGWAQFEELCQALLKTALGMGVQAWGGSGDFGRDAYYGGLLSKRAKTAGDASAKHA